MKKEIIAHRKKCEADGTGLSHYILMNKKDSQSGESPQPKGLPPGTLTKSS